MTLKQDLLMLLKNPKDMLGKLTNIRTNLMDATVIRDVFIDQPYHWLVQGLRPGTVAIDIGAYVGETAVYLAMQREIKKVMAYEPILSSYKRAVRNVEASPYRSKINMVNKAVTDRKGTVTSAAGLRGTPNVVLDATKATRGVEIPTTTLERELSGLARVVIKCDCEGDEIKIFKGADLRNVYRIELKYHNTRREMLRMLTLKGFKATVKFGRKGIFWKDIGFICAWKV